MPPQHLFALRLCVKGCCQRSSAAGCWRLSHFPVLPGEASRAQDIPRGGDTSHRAVLSMAWGQRHEDDVGWDRMPGTAHSPPRSCLSRGDGTEAVPLCLSCSIWRWTLLVALMALCSDATRSSCLGANPKSWGCPALGHNWEAATEDKITAFQTEPGLAASW